MNQDYRKRAEELCDKLMLRFELKHGTVGTQISIIQGVLSEVADEARRDEAGKHVQIIKGKNLEAGN